MNYIAIIVTFVVGFLIGGLVYRNNAKKIEREAKELKQELDDLRERLIKRRKR